MGTFFYVKQKKLLTVEQGVNYNKGNSWTAAQLLGMIIKFWLIRKLNKKLIK